MAGQIDEFISRLKRLKEVEEAFTFVSPCGQVLLVGSVLCMNPPPLSAEKERFQLLPLPFCQVLDDPSGNSFVENPRAPQRDEALAVARYKRSAQQNAMLGIQVSQRRGCVGMEAGWRC